MIKTDYHLHTNFSIDSKAMMEDMVEAAVQKGLTEIIFTDHFDRASAGHEILQYTKADYWAYKEKLDELQAIYKEKITLKWGVEIGINIEFFEETNAFTKAFPFEFIIGSIHDIEKQEIYLRDYFNDMDKKTAYETYFKVMYEAVQVNDFDVVGHFDYAPRYAPFKDPRLDYIDYKTYIDEILKYIIKADKGMELNTSGYAFGVGRHHPQLDILKAYYDFGGRIITVGSDAHKAEDVGRHREEAYTLLREAGFSEYTLFRERKPYFKAL